MKLHLFSSGTITAWKHLLIRGEQEGIRIITGHDPGPWQKLQSEFL